MPVSRVRRIKRAQIRQRFIRERRLLLDKYVKGKIDLHNLEIDNFFWLDTPFSVKNMNFNPNRTSRPAFGYVNHIRRNLEDLLGTGGFYESTGARRISRAILFGILPTARKKLNVLINIPGKERIPSHAKAVLGIIKIIGQYDPDKAFELAEMARQSGYRIDSAKFKRK